MSASTNIDLHADIADYIIAILIGQDLCKHLPGMKHCVTFQEMIIATITCDFQF